MIYNISVRMKRSLKGSKYMFRSEHMTNEFEDCLKDIQFLEHENIKYFYDYKYNDLNEKILLTNQKIYQYTNSNWEAINYINIKGVELKQEKKNINGFFINLKDGETKFITMSALIDKRFFEALILMTLIRNIATDIDKCNDTDELSAYLEIS